MQCPQRALGVSKPMMQTQTSMDIYTAANAHRAVAPQNLAPSNHVSRTVSSRRTRPSVNHK
eukprot:5134894-Lingulodinium_polyedra.AAC.1